MIFFDTQKKRRQRILNGCAAIRSLMELNEKTPFNPYYGHHLQLLHCLPTRDALDAFGELDAIRIAKPQVEKLLSAKDQNKERWAPYFAEVNNILTAHPFSEEEAKQCQIKEKDYFSLAYQLFLECVRKPDEEEITCSLRLGVVGGSGETRIFVLSEAQLREDEKQLIPEETPIPVEEKAEKKVPEEAAITELSPEEGEPVMEEEEEPEVEKEDEPLEEEPSEEPIPESPKTEEELTLDEVLAVPPFRETVIEEEPTTEETVPPEIEEPALSEEETPSNSPVSEEKVDSAEPDKELTMRDFAKKDPELWPLYDAFRQDKSMVGVIARELVLAKGMKTSEPSADTSSSRD